MANQVKFCAAPHIAEPNKKQAIAKKRSGFRPAISDIFPKTGAKARKRKLVILPYMLNGWRWPEVQSWR